MSSVKKVENKNVYIAGPMSGLPDFNFPAFDRAAEMLAERGLEPMNPAEIGRRWIAENGNRQPTKSEYNALLVEGRKMLRKCGRVYLLRGWERSNGARGEVSYALILGLDLELEGAQ